MRRENISKALGAIDERFILEALAYSLPNGSSAGKENTSMADTGHKARRISKRKLLRTCLIAAVLAALFTITAYAAVSINARRQQELRQKLNIDGSNTASYVEYGDDGSGGVVLLSAINDGEFQRVYLNVSPVEKSDIEAWADGISFCWSISEDCGGIAAPVMRPGRTLSGRDEIISAVLEDAYDGETKTLTLECYIPNENLTELDSSVMELTLIRFDADAFNASGYGSKRGWAQDTGNVYGTVSFASTEHEVRYMDFGGAVITDTETGTEVTLYGLELSPTAAVWRVDYDSAEELITGQCPADKQVYYIMIGDRICAEAELHLADGSIFSTGGYMTAEYVNGEARLYCAWGGAAIDISAVESITLDGAPLSFTG